MALGGTVMSVKEKLLVAGVLLAIAAGFLGHRYWSAVVEVLQRMVAAGFVAGSAAEL